MAKWDFKTYGHIWRPTKRPFSDVEHCNCTKTQPVTQSWQNKKENTFGGILHKSTEAWKCQIREYGLIRYGSRKDIHVQISYCTNNEVNPLFVCRNEEIYHLKWLKRTKYDFLCNLSTTARFLCMFITHSFVQNDEIFVCVFGMFEDL